MFSPPTDDQTFKDLLDDMKSDPSKTEDHLLKYMRSRGFSTPFQQNLVTNTYQTPSIDKSVPIIVQIEGFTKFQEIEATRQKATTEMNLKLLDFFNNVSEYNKLKELPTSTLGGGNDNKKLFERTLATPKQISDFIQIEKLIGIQDIKNRVSSQIIEPLSKPKLYPAANSKNIGMFGPPGTGKTMVAKGIAASIKTLLPNTKLKFFNISSSTVTSSDRGGTEKNLKAIFDEAAKIPTDLNTDISKWPIETSYLGVIFIDEFESFAKSRELETNEYKNQVTTELLQLLDGFQSGKKGDRPMVIFATNLLSIIDSAILSRFGIILYISEPTPEDRHKLTLIDLGTRVDEQSSDSISIIGNLIDQIKTYLAYNKLDFYKQTAFLSNRNISTLVSELINYKYSELGSGKTESQIETFIKNDDQKIWPIAMQKALEKIKIPYGEILDIEYFDLFKEAPPLKEIKDKYDDKLIEDKLVEDKVVEDKSPKNSSIVFQYQSTSKSTEKNKEKKTSISHREYYIIIMKLLKTDWEREIIFYYIRNLVKSNVKQKDYSLLFTDDGRQEIISHIDSKLTNGIEWSKIDWNF